MSLRPGPCLCDTWHVSQPGRALEHSSGAPWHTGRAMEPATDTGGRAPGAAGAGGHAAARAPPPSALRPPSDSWLLGLKLSATGVHTGRPLALSVSGSLPLSSKRSAGLQVLPDVVQPDPNLLIP